MEYRPLGRTGFHVSVLGFGCGGVGGLLTGDDQRLMIAVVERALELGINYFDTAQLYGDGKSERNLGQVLQILKPDVVVGTKIRLTPPDMERIEPAVTEAVELSLTRLQFEQIPLLQLHNALGLQRHLATSCLGPAQLEQVILAFEKLRSSGKIHAWGINGLGDTDALHQAVAHSGAATMQICYNLLNPSAGRLMPSDFPFQDYRNLISAAGRMQMGVIAFRVLAGGALSDQTDRHPTAASSVDPIASSHDYQTDQAHSRAFAYLVSQGWVTSLAEAAIRFAVSHAGVATALVGFSSMDQLEQAVTAVNRGALPPNATTTFA